MTADSELLLPFGLDISRDADTLVHISEVRPEDAGLACKLICPGCRRRLIAYKNVVKKVEHFGHESGAICVHGYQTALHLYAKELIANQKRLTLPNGFAKRGRRVIAAKCQAFDAVFVEQRFHEVIPDVIAQRRRRRLLVEILVTHPCGERKRAILTKRDTPAVEIDLSKLRGVSDRSELDRLILEAAPRAWLFHPKIVELDAEQDAAEARRERQSQQRRAFTQAEAAQNEKEQLAAKKAWIKAAVDGLRAATEPQRWGRFSFDFWYNKRRWGGYSIADMVDLDPTAAEGYVHQINAVRNTIKSGQLPTDDILGLPIERAPAERAPLGLISSPRAFSWPRTPYDPDQVDRLLKGRSDTIDVNSGASIPLDEGVGWPTRVQSPEEQAAQQRMVAESVASRCVSKLRAAAHELQGPDRAPYWLNGTHPRLHGKPVELVRDAESLAKCLGQLEMDTKKKVPKRYRE